MAATGLVDCGRLLVGFMAPGELAFESIHKEIIVKRNITDEQCDDSTDFVDLFVECDVVLGKIPVIIRVIILNLRSRCFN